MSDEHSHLIGMSEAAELSGRHRSVIDRAAKAGELSVAHKNDKGHRFFDPSEVRRWKEAKESEEGERLSEDGAETHPRDTERDSEFVRLQEQLTAAHKVEMLLSEQLEHEREQSKRAQLLLTDQTRKSDERDAEYRAAVQRVAELEASAKVMHEKQAELQTALEQERSRSFWQRLLGR